MAKYASVKVSESVEQTCLFRWASYSMGKYPQLKWLYHVPNGGKRDKATAAKLKAEGVKAGVPDICLPVARGEFHGLYIELKAGKNKATALQREWLEALDLNGYKTAICYGWVEASELIKNYLISGDYQELS